MHISGIINLVAHNKPVFKGLSGIIKNQFRYGENKCDFYFQNSTVSLYKKNCVLCTVQVKKLQIRD